MSGTGVFTTILRGISMLRGHHVGGVDFGDGLT